MYRLTLTTPSLLPQPACRQALTGLPWPPLRSVPAGGSVHRPPLTCGVTSSSTALTQALRCPACPFRWVPPQRGPIMDDFPYTVRLWLPRPLRSSPRWRRYAHNVSASKPHHVRRRERPRASTRPGSRLRETDFRSSGSRTPRVGVGAGLGSGVVVGVGSGVRLETDPRTDPLVALTDQRTACFGAGCDIATNPLKRVPPRRTSAQGGGDGA
jgi:hypothetical protein